jgi:hypothetical protein
LKLLRLCALTAFLSATGPNALADTTSFQLVATFVDLCGETHGDANHALSMADHAGWEIPPPKALRPPPFGSAQWTAIDGRVLHLPSGVRMLWVGTQADLGGRYAQSCALVDWTPRPASPQDFALIQAVLAKWVGGGPVMVDATSGFAKFAFREVGGERRALAADDPALSADIPPADVGEVTMMSALGKPMIMYMRWR